MSKTELINNFGEETLKNRHHGANAKTLTLSQSNADLSDNLRRRVASLIESKFDLLC